jgi:hypothetical protein
LVHDGWARATRFLAPCLDINVAGGRGLLSTSREVYWTSSFCMWRTQYEVQCTGHSSRGPAPPTIREKVLLRTSSPLSSPFPPHEPPVRRKQARPLSESGGRRESFGTPNRLPSRRGDGVEGRSFEEKDQLSNPFFLVVAALLRIGASCVYCSHRSSVPLSVRHLLEWSVFLSWGYIMYGWCLSP